MPWTDNHKQASRQRILTSAARLFTHKGYDNVSINEVMADASLTRGAFYTHFSSKSELYAESIITAAMSGSSLLQQLASGKQSLASLTKAYLSLEHREGEMMHCPLAFLVTDVSQRDDTVRNVYTKAFRGFVNKLSTTKPDKNTKPSVKALQAAVLMIGGLAIARAINEEELAEQLLSACQQGVQV
ncbi:TetR/AcrR family transcriptional regulator [Endozoicomonas sp. SM1973]|uniref:TetR/AcrR family transcriptional regulator n=1 Tax=Spartinivicinus marinus TaxID=2994442 RepID=A0A853IFA7_9GAMM|nr:TetR/AcrR family transcriptional regulator [Spartinivicinus marinus]MCX4027369.1 TetR/AcrR family transcriptional regulator [Spartinivicinus marinus]NYZ69218.1 TetR/AcrR family transcriptional regulator [Spartinivicinus marinus]